LLEDIGKVFALIAIAYLTNRLLISNIMKHAAKNLELLFITGISICFLFAALASYLGFSIAIGAFIAGVCIGSLPYSLEIVGRVKSLKDFFIVIFFVTLGSQITFGSLGGNLKFIFIIAALTLILKPIIIFILLKFFKYSNRTSFFSAISLGQISEFSLVLAASGLAVKQISQDIFNVVIIVAIITITLTPYLVEYANRFYNSFSKFLEPLEKLSSKKGLEKLPTSLNHHLILFGAHRMGSKVIENLKPLTNNFVVVDFNPERIRELIAENINCIYGDITSPEVLEKLELSHAKVIISTVPDLKQNLFILKKIKSKNPRATVFVTAKNIDDSIQLYREGADFVAFPEMLAGQKVVDYMTHLDESEIKKWGANYYKELLKEKRKNPLVN
jgi:FlaA1/EpsC-like NDP-sugar epimerase